MKDEMEEMKGDGIRRERERSRAEEGLARRYRTLAAIPMEYQGGYVRGFLAGIRDALIALGKLEVISIISKVHESDSSEVPEG